MDYRDEMREALMQCGVLREERRRFQNAYFNWMMDKSINNRLRVGDIGLLNNYLSNQGLPKLHFDLLPELNKKAK